MHIEDDRTEREHKTHESLIFAHDIFLSGWGGAKKGKSYCAWVCKKEHEQQVLNWVESRPDLHRVRLLDNDYTPQGGKNDHYQIYVVNEGHPALKKDGQN